MKTPIQNNVKSDNISINNNGIIFPRPFFLAIDDIGWNLGRNDGDVDGKGPYRIGLNRKMKLSDYECMVDVAKKVGVRFQGLFVMGEMDRENILATVPSTNVDGAKWDNSANVSDEQIEIMDYVRDNAAWLEFGLHGVGHEHWPVAQQRKRAEWYCTTDNHPWEQSEIAKHIGVFKHLMGQYGLSEENGHSFPESFVPCAYAYHWNPDGDYSTGSMLGAAGVKYANTLFTYVEELNPPQGDNSGGIDHGVVVINRLNYGNPWYELSSLPTTPIEEQKSDIIESHWTNWLVQDDFLQESLNQEWTDYIEDVATIENRYKAKNTEQFSAQWLYKKYTVVSEKTKGSVLIDNTNMPKEIYENNLLHNLVLKVKLKNGQHVSLVKLNNKIINVYSEEGGYGLIHLPMLDRKVYTLDYAISDNRMNSYLEYDGTFNIYSFEDNSSINLRMYGTQDVKITGISEPINIKSSNPNLKIKKLDYDTSNKVTTITISALDIQGETGVISWE